RLGVVDRAATIARKAVAAGPDNVDVGGTLHNALFENPEAFIDERTETALDDLFLTVRELRHLQLGRTLAQNRDGLRIIVTGAVAFLIAIIALAVLLSQPPRFHQREIRLIVGWIDRIFVSVCRMHAGSDIDAGHVEDGENAHCHAPLLQRRIDFARRRTFPYHPLGFARIALHHAVTHESVADLR